MELEGRVAIVTGGAGDLGRAAALALADSGAAVVIADTVESPFKEVAREVLDRGGSSAGIAVDVTDRRSIDGLIEECLERFRRIDLLVSCAGIARGQEQWGENNWKSIEELSEADWRRIIDINLTGTFLCCQAVGKVMIEQRHGVIINVGSISGVVANKGLLGHGAYCASKAGVIGLTRALAAEWAPNNIRVNCVSPGYMATRMVERVRKNLPEVYTTQVDMTPMGRFGEPQEFAALVVFLASTGASYITGQNLLMDGGYTAW